MFVPVLNSENQPLMPTTPSRARRWIKSGKATGFWKKGVFCVRLNVKSEENKQPIAIGIDPGSKKEAFTVKSNAHTYLNIQADAVTWVKEVMEVRRNARRTRRYRKTPCRKPRFNRAKGGLAPSTKARWQWKLRILTWLYRLYPISNVIVEDIVARTKGQREWDVIFSPLQIGKNWFYSQVPNLILKYGWDTKKYRDILGLKKIGNKLSKSFNAHCVDSWVLANHVVAGSVALDNIKMLYIRPLRFHRRQLHLFRFEKGGIRRPYGSTISLGLKRGSLVKHPKHGVAYVGGTTKKRISLHSFDGTRIAKNVKVEDCKFLCYNSWVITK